MAALQHEFRQDGDPFVIHFIVAALPPAKGPHEWDRSSWMRIWLWYAWHVCKLGVRGFRSRFSLLFLTA